MTSSINTPTLIIILIVIISTSIAASILVYKNRKPAECTDTSIVGKITELENTKHNLTSSISQSQVELTRLSNVFELYNDIDTGTIEYTMNNYKELSFSLHGILFKSPTDLVFNKAIGPTEFSLSDAPYWKFDVYRKLNKDAIIFGKSGDDKNNEFRFSITDNITENRLELYNAVNPECIKIITTTQLWIPQNFFTITLQFDFEKRRIYISLGSFIFYVPFDDLNVNEDTVIKGLMFGVDNIEQYGIYNLNFKNCIIGNIDIDNFIEDGTIHSWNDDNL